MADVSECTNAAIENVPVVQQASQQRPITSEPEPLEGELSLTEDDEYQTDLTNIIISSETVHPTLHRPGALYKLSSHRVNLPPSDTEGEEPGFDGTVPMETNPSPEPPSMGVPREALVSPGGAKDNLDCTMDGEKGDLMQPPLTNAKTSNVPPDLEFGVVPLSPTPSAPLPTLTVQEPSPPQATSIAIASSADNDAEMPLEESNDSLFALDNTSQNELSESLLASSEIVDSIIQEVDERGKAALNELNGDVSEFEFAKISTECQKEFFDTSEEILTLNVNESLNSSIASTRDLGEMRKGNTGAENFDEISDIENWDDIEGGDDELWKLSLQPCSSSREEREEAKRCEESHGMREHMSPISSGDEFGDNEGREKREGSEREGENEGEEGEDKDQIIGQSILVIGGGAACHGRYQSRSRDRGFDYNEPLSPPPNDPPPKPQEAKSSNANLTRIIKLSEDATSDISDSSFKDTIDDFEEVSRTKHKPSKSRHISRSHESSSHPKDLAFSDKLFVDAKYFIMKSNNHENIRIAKEKYVWSTPLPNEKKLSQSYRQHKNIILLFSVRESGRFQGFAKLASDVKRNGPPIQWHLPHGINANSLGGVFRLQWIYKEDLEFSKCQDVSNPWNDHKPVKISRDGQELPPGIGEKLCRLWFERPDTPPVTTPTAKPSISSPNEAPTSSDTQQQTTTSSVVTNTSTSQVFTSTAPLHYPAFPYPYLQPGASTPHSVQLQSYLAQAQQQQLLAAQGVRHPASYAYPYLQQIQNYAAMAQSMQALSHAQQANKLALWNAENQQQRKAMVAAMSYLKEAGFSKTKSPNNERTPSPASKRRRISSDTSSKKSQHDLRHSLHSGKEKAKESRSYHRSNSSRSAKSRHSSSSKHRRYSSSRKYSSSKSHKERPRTRSRSSSSPHTQEYESDNKKSYQVHESRVSPEPIQISPAKDPTQEFGVKEEIFLHGSYDDYLKEMKLKGINLASQGKQKSRESTST